MKIPKFLTPNKKDKSSVPNVIYIAIEEVSEELLFYIAAINNRNLTTTIQNRESLKKRIKQIAKYKNDKIVIPCLAFSVQNNGELINKLCPFPYDLDYPQKIENEDIHVYEYHTVRDHMARGIVFKELDKIMKSKRNEHADLLEFITDIGKPLFKEKLEGQIEKFRNNCCLGKNVLNRAPLKRSQSDLVQFLYNYDSSVFNHVVQLCEYHPSNNFVSQMGTMVYHSTLEENQNTNDKTYIVNQEQDHSSSNETREISSPLAIPSSSEEDVSSAENPSKSVNPSNIPLEPTVAYQETPLEEESRSAAEKIDNSHIEQLPLEPTAVQNISTDHIISEASKTFNEQNKPQDVPVTNSQLSEILLKTLGPNPFKVSKEQNQIGNCPETDPEIVKLKKMFAKSCSEQTETNKLLEKTQLSDASIQRMQNAAKLPTNNETMNLIDLTPDPLTEETSFTHKENEKSKVGFDSLQNQIKYISTGDQSSSLKKPKFGDKNRIAKNQKLPASIVKKGIKKPNFSNLIKTENDNETLPFTPHINSTPHHKQESTSVKTEDSKLLSNNYEVTDGDDINPGRCLHGCENQAQCNKCIADLIKFANEHHNNFVSKDDIKTENIEQPPVHKNIPINTVSKNRKSKSRNSKNRNRKSSSSSSEKSEDEKPRKPKGKSVKNKKRKSSSDESSDSDDSLPDFESSRYSNISKNSEKLKGLKFRNTLKYPKLTREAALDPNKYFDRFIATLQLNIDGGQLYDCPLHCVSHILAEQMLDNFEAQEEIFSNLADTARSLKDIRSAFRKALSESVILREKRFEDITEKPKDITWKSFASNLFQIFKNAFPLEKDPLNSKLLILKFKSLINKDLRKSYELSKVGGKNNDQNLFEIAEVLDKIASFSILETEEKSVFSIQKEVTFSPKERTEKNNSKEANGSKNAHNGAGANLRNHSINKSNSNFQHSRDAQNQGRPNGPRLPFNNGGRPSESQNRSFQSQRNFQNSNNFQHSNNYHAEQRHSYYDHNAQHSRNYRNFSPPGNSYPNQRSNSRYHNDPNNYRQPYYNRGGDYSRNSNNNSYNNYRPQRQPYTRNYNEYNNQGYYNQPSRENRLNHKYRY